MSPGYGRVALVSGGSRGIGAATVRRLAADGPGAARAGIIGFTMALASQTRRYGIRAN